MLVIVGVIVVLFIGLILANNYKNNQAMDGKKNPYDKEELHQLTIDQLEDPNYQNQITPNELSKKLDEKEDVTVYFYSPDCIHCQRTTPVLVPLTEELDVDVKKLNLLEYKNEWQVYGIEGTPTLVHFENGKEVARITGEQDESTLRTFLEDNVLHQ